jgi:branched-subunit amino acid aminotransferase/4-amino-4-deoxychorismate lyase
MTDQAVKNYCTQCELVIQLKDLYALVNVSRLAMTNQGQDETDTVFEVLMIAGNRLFDLTQQQQAIAKQLERIAYPESEEEDAA